MFKREKRYLVAKISDAKDALTTDELFRLEAILSKIEKWRSEVGKSPLQVVVVEHDWPNYEDTWAAVQSVAEGKYEPISSMKQQIRQLKEELVDVQAYADGRDAYINGLRKGLLTVQKERDELKERISLLSK